MCGKQASGCHDCFTYMDVSACTHIHTPAAVCKHTYKHKYICIQSFKYVYILTDSVALQFHTYLQYILLTPFFFPIISSSRHPRSSTAHFLHSYFVTRDTCVTTAFEVSVEPWQGYQFVRVRGQWFFYFLKVSLANSSAMASRIPLGSCFIHIYLWVLSMYIIFNKS